jgi:hypothetical protein
VEHHSIIRPVQTVALAAFMTLGSLFMATGAGAQATPEGTPSASPVAVTGTEVDNLGCWAEEPDSSVAGYPQWSSQPEMKIDPAKTYIATIKTNRGDIVIQLYADVAPNTVNNFVCLATEDYYDGVVFHRVMRDFMIQTGDPTATGRGGPGYQIGDELPGEELNYDVVLHQPCQQLGEPAEELHDLRPGDRRDGRGRYDRGNSGEPEREWRGFQAIRDPNRAGYHHH